MMYTFEPTHTSKHFNVCNSAGCVLRKVFITEDKQSEHSSVLDVNDNGFMLHMSVVNNVVTLVTVKTTDGTIEFFSNMNACMSWVDRYFSDTDEPKTLAACIQLIRQEGYGIQF